MIIIERNGKNYLRDQTLSNLSTLTKEEKRQIEISLMNHLVSSVIWKQAKTVGITYSTRLEWNTIPIIEQAWKEGKTVVIPKANPENSSMNFYQIDAKTELIPGFGGILEPPTIKERMSEKEAIDLLIVPGIVFDQYGYRVGFGGGYYDRFLVNFNNITVSLLSLQQLLPKLPIEKHDIRVQYLITETGIFNAKSSE